MKTLSETEVRQWCEQPSISISVNRYGLLSYGKGNDCSATIEVPQDSELRVALSHSLLSYRDFYGGLLWIKEWRMGDLNEVAVGLRLLENMRRGMGHLEPIEATSGHLFRSDEFLDAQAFLSVMLLWSWQAFWVPTTPGYFYYLHHNNKVELNAGDQNALSDLQCYLSGWRPIAGSALGLR
jgi:hypothetical protein